MSRKILNVMFYHRDCQKPAPERMFLNERKLELKNESAFVSEF